MRLERPAPFDVGRPVMIAIQLPDATEPLSLRAEVRLGGDDEDDGSGGRELAFIEPSTDARAAIERYVADRLGLPSL